MPEGAGPSSDCVTQIQTVSDLCNAERDTVSLIYPRNATALPDQQQILDSLSSLLAAAQPSPGYVDAWVWGEGKGTRQECSGRFHDTEADAHALSVAQTVPAIPHRCCSGLGPVLVGKCLCTQYVGRMLGEWQPGTAAR